MYSGKEFTAQNPGEIENFTFDYRNLLGTAETLLTAEWTVQVVSGTDADAQLRVDNSPPYVISGSKVTQQLGPGLDGVVYRIICVAVTNTGQEIELYSHCRCAAPDAA